MKNNLSNRILFLFSIVSMSVGFMGFFGPSMTRRIRSDKPERFDYLVREDMFAGFRGDSSALHRAMKLCEDTLKSNPNHSQALVWHGCAIWYLSGQAFRSGDFQKGMALSDSGMGEMDRAVDLDSNNAAVRIPRGAAILAAAPYIPEPNRTILLRKGLADYERTYVLQTGYFSKLPVHSRGELLGGMADACRRLGESKKAKEYFSLIATELQGSEYAVRANNWLETKEFNKPNSELKSATCIGCHTEN